MADIFRSSNPVLKESTFAGQPITGQAMTIQGTVNKTGALLLCVVCDRGLYLGLGALRNARGRDAVDHRRSHRWIHHGADHHFQDDTGLPLPLRFYALLEGFFLGGISAFFERSYPGIAVRAISLTFAVLLVLLLAYKTGLVRATRGFKLGVIAATGGIALVYLANMVMSIFFHTQMSFLYSSSPLGIGISLFVVVIAALNLILDFDMIENAARAGAPRYMEWYGAFGMMVTLIWLYLEILRLLSKLNRR